MDKVFTQGLIFDNHFGGTYQYAKLAHRTLEIEKGGTKDVLIASFLS